MNTTRIVYVAAETVDEALSISISPQCHFRKQDVKKRTATYRKLGWPKTESWELTVTAKKLGGPKEHAPRKSK